MPDNGSGRLLRIFQVDAFTRTRFAGNPAGVVPNADHLTDREMQAIARELNASETAFLLRPRADDHDVHVRYFTPTTEVPVCGHATIAAHFVRAIEGEHPAGLTRQLCGAGVLTVEVEPRELHCYRIWMDQRPPEFGDVLLGERRAALLSALRLEARELGDGPIQIVSTGHSKVLTPLRSRERLNEVKPDLARLAQLSQAIGCNGYHLFVTDGADPGLVAHGRMFAPAIGIAEDPVTGNANGPLGAYLVKYGIAPTGPGSASFSGWFSQGEAMGRPGRVKVIVQRDAAGEPTAVRIGGDAVVAFRAELCL